MSNNQSPTDIKLVIVGDGACGKTSLLSVFVNNKFPEDYTPTVFDNQVKKFFIDEKEIKLALWDTAGQEDYDKLRPLSYDHVDVFIIVYSIDDAGSLYNIVDLWIPEIQQHCGKDVPIIMVGNKSDLRNYNQKPGNAIMELTTKEEAKQVSKQIGAKDFIECSALTGVNVFDVFVSACQNTKKLNPESSQSSKFKCAGMPVACQIL